MLRSLTGSNLMGRRKLAFLVILAAITRCYLAQTTWQFSFVENTGANHSVGRITLAGSQFRFSDTTGLCDKYFTLVLSSGEIQTKMDIDREVVLNATHDHSDRIQCPVLYTAHPSNLQQSLVVQITVEDVNDQVPRFFGLASPVHNINVFENVAVGQPLIYLAPDDQDEGANGTVHFSITGGNDLGVFILNLAMGDDNSSEERILYLNKPLDRETNHTFNLSLTLSDMGTPPQTAVQYIVITVVDVDESPPEFVTSTMTFDVPENHPLGPTEPFGSVSAVDTDSESNSAIFYFFDNSSVIDHADQYFAVTPVSGELYLLQRLNFENTGIPDKFNFRILARNPGSNLGNIVTIHVNVLDRNDEPPLAIGHPSVMAVLENQDYYPMSLLVRDQDANITHRGIGDVQIQFSPNVSHSTPVYAFILENVGLSQISMNITQPLDRESTPSLVATFTVTDSGTPPLTSVVNVTINVMDVNDNFPHFNEPLQATVSESSAVGKEVLQISAEDKDNGVNGTVRYSITGVHPVAVSNWFAINETSGMLTLSSHLDYTDATAVTIEVTASDMGSPPLSNTTQVSISISPPVTFPPRSYQLYHGYNLLQDPIIYMEFITGSTNGLLMYQTAENGDEFRALEIEDGKLVYSTGTNTRHIVHDVTIEVDMWYSVLINQTLNILVDVWHKGTKSTDLLRTANLQGCEGSTQNTGPELSIGGLKNAFAIPANRIQSRDFLGAIRTIIIDNKQIDMRCPQSSSKTLTGFIYSPSCPRECFSPSDHILCVRYAAVSHCQCKGGFNQSVCKSTSDYGAITISRGSALQFTLDNDFFFDARYRDPQTPLTPGGDRSHILQTVAVSFMPASSNLSGVIFYYRTDTSTQVMEVQETLRYTVYDSQQSARQLLVSQSEFDFQVGQEYQFIVEVTNTTANMYQLGKTDDRKVLDSEHIQSSTIFSQTAAMLSLGGTQDDSARFVEGDFAGCINSVVIDGVSIPLQGILSSEEKTVTGPQGGLGTGCHDCYSGACPANSTCEVRGPTSDNTYICICNNREYTLTDGVCTAPGATPPATVETTPTRDGSSINSDKLPLFIIAGVAAAVLLLIVVLLVVGIVLCRCMHNRHKQRTTVFESHPSRTTTQQQQQQHEGQCNGVAKANRETAASSAQLRRNNDYVTHKLVTTESPTIQRLNTERNSTCSPSSARSRSVSQETGFHTSSEPGDSRRNSHRSDFPIDSDFSTCDTDSVNFTGTSGIEDAISPHDMHLVSSGSTMGVPLNFRRKHPLTPQERNALTPLRPNSDLLSETATDLSLSHPPARPYMMLDNESQESDSTVNKWYASNSPSTIVDDNNVSPHSLQAAALHKQRRSKKHNLPQFVQLKNLSPAHHYPYMYQPHSSSPLVHSQRFNFPAVSPLEPPRFHGIPPSVGYPYHTLHHPPHHTYHPRQYSDHSCGEAAAPIHIRGISDTAYYPSYQDSSLASDHPGTLPYRDLNSFAQGVNPITYWEQQTRLRPTVDQDDPLHLLAGPCVPFEDVSTEPSVVESTIVGDNQSSVIYMPSAQELPSKLKSPSKLLVSPKSTSQSSTHSYNMESHRDINSQGMAEPMTDTTNLNSSSGSSTQTQSQSQTRPQLTRVNITHFPTADCTPSYNNHSSNTLMSPDGPNGFQIESSQVPLCV